MCILTVRFLSPPTQFLETRLENINLSESGYKEACPFGNFLLVNAFLHEAFNGLPYSSPGVSAIWALLGGITVEQMFQSNHPVAFTTHLASNSIGRPGCIDTCSFVDSCYF